MYLCAWGTTVQIKLQCPSHGHDNLRGVLGLQPTQVQKGGVNSELLHERGAIITSAANPGSFRLRRYDCIAAYFQHSA